MSDTALSLVTDSLEAILIQASEQSVQPADFRTGIRYLNRMMNERILATVTASQLQDLQVFFKSALGGGEGKPLGGLA